MSEISDVMIASADKYRIRRMSHGFSTLEVIVVAGMILALAVVGFFTYDQISHSSKVASTESAASAVYTAALSAEADGDSETTSEQVQSNFNNSQDEIEVTITINK